MSEQIKHHPIFEQFTFKDYPEKAGYRINGLGVIERKYFYDETVISVWKDRCSTIPVLDEEYLEWVSVLEAVSAARGSFTMVELGAGYGPWVVNAIAALRQQGDLPFHIIAVEADPEHFRYLREHLSDNGIDPDKQSLLPFAVTGSGGTVTFEGGDPRNWYGQSINRNEIGRKNRLRGLITKAVPALRKLAPENHNYVTVKALTLSEILEMHAHVDLIDMDIQGEEASVVESAISTMNDKVKRVHIGTHGHDIEDRLRSCFLANGWSVIDDYRSNLEQTTPYGTFFFHDGVQSWVNPNK